MNGKVDGVFNTGTSDDLAFLLSVRWADWDRLLEVAREAAFEGNDSSPWLPATISLPKFELMKFVEKADSQTSLSRWQLPQGDTS